MIVNVLKITLNGFQVIFFTHKRLFSVAFISLGINGDQFLQELVRAKHYEEAVVRIQTKQRSKSYRAPHTFL